MIFSNCKTLFLAFIALTCLFMAQTAHGDDKLKVGIAEIGPFVIQDANGQWTGLGIEVWEHAARTHGLAYEYLPMPHHDLYEAVQKGTVDVAISDFATDHDLEETLEYSRTFFHSDLAIASKVDAGSIFLQVIDTLTSPTALTIIAAMIFLIFFAAFVFWVIENRDSGELYVPEHKKFNFFNGAIWAILLLTAQEPDVFRNKSFIGRVFAMMLLAIGVTVSASYIAIITSSITVNQMTTKVHSVDDLPFIRIGSLNDTRATKYLDEHHLRHKTYEEMEPMMAELRAGVTDAVVADDVILRYYVRRHSDEKLAILPVHLETEYYALTFPEWSDLDDLINSSILEFIESPLWKELLARHVGKNYHANN